MKTPIFDRILFLMENYPVVEGEENEWDKSGNDLKMLLWRVLPLPEDTFNDNHFGEPLFLVQILFEMSKFYGFDKAPNAIFDYLYSSKLKTDNIILRTHIWFSLLILPNANFVLLVVNRYRFGRRSSNPITRSIEIE